MKKENTVQSTVVDDSDDEDATPEMPTSATGPEEDSDVNQVETPTPVVKKKRVIKKKGSD